MLFLWINTINFAYFENNPILFINTIGINQNLRCWMIHMTGYFGNAGFSSFRRRNNPIISVPDNRTYKCDMCFKSYKHKESLYKHRKFECNKEPQFRCPHCPHRSRRKDNMRLHVSMKHRSFKRITFST